MTLLNHIGLLVLLVLILVCASVFSEELRDKWLYSFPAAGMVWLIFEAFYWTINIFFLN